MNRETARYHERLTKLRDYVEDLPSGYYKHETLVSKLDKKPCGTIACAFGHAIANKNTLFPGLRPIKVFHDPDAWNEEEKIGYIFPYIDPNLRKLTGGDDMLRPEQWANWYFGPNAWDNIFSNKPYEDLEDHRPSSIKRAVLARMNRQLRLYENS